MRNVYDVLREKEAEIKKVSQQLSALRLIAPLLEEPGDIKAAMVKAAMAADALEYPPLSAQELLKSDPKPTE